MTKPFIIYIFIADNKVSYEGMTKDLYTRIRRKRDQQRESSKHSFATQAMVAKAFSRKSVLLLGVNWERRSKRSKKAEKELESIEEVKTQRKKSTRRSIN